MSALGMTRTALWTEIRAAILEDFPDLEVPHSAPPALLKCVISNADYIAELQAAADPSQIST